MKKTICLITGLVFLSGISLFSASSVNITTFTASVSFESISPIVYFDIELKDIQTNTAKTTFTFTPVPGCLGIGTTFYTANEYAVIYTTWTSASNGRLLVYTDNTASDANPKYTGSGNPAGLVCATETTSSDAPLSLCWRVTDVSTTTYKIGWYLDGNKMKLYAIGLPQNYWCFIWMKDKGDGQWASQNDIAYATVKSFDFSGSWIQHAEMTFGSAPSPDYFYLGCNFENAKVGKTYKTSN